MHGEEVRPEVSIKLVIRDFVSTTKVPLRMFSLCVW